MLVSETVPGADSGAVVVVDGNASPVVGGEVSEVVGGLKSATMLDEGRVTPGFCVGRYVRGGSSTGAIVAIASSLVWRGSYSLDPAASEGWLWSSPFSPLVPPTRAFQASRRFAVPGPGRDSAYGAASSVIAEGKQKKMVREDRSYRLSFQRRESESESEPGREADWEASGSSVV